MSSYLVVISRTRRIPYVLGVGSSGNVPLKVFKLERLSLVLPLSTFAPIHLTLCLTANTSTLEILNYLTPMHGTLFEIGFSFALHVWSPVRNIG